MLAEFEVGVGGVVVDEPTQVSVAPGGIEAQPPGSRDRVGCLYGKTALAILGILGLQLDVELRVYGVDFVGPVLTHV